MATIETFKKAMPRTELANKIGMFLVRQDLGLFDTWEGRLTAKESMKAFGYYFGRGKLEINGETDQMHFTSRGTTRLVAWGV